MNLLKTDNEILAGLVIAGKLQIGELPMAKRNTVKVLVKNLQEPVEEIIELEEVVEKPKPKPKGTTKNAGKK